MNECSGASKTLRLVVASTIFDVESSAIPMVGEMIAMFRALPKSYHDRLISVFRTPRSPALHTFVGDLV